MAVELEGKTRSERDQSSPHFHVVGYVFSSIASRAEDACVPHCQTCPDRLRPGSQYSPVGVPGPTPGRTAIPARPNGGTRVYPSNADQREDCEQNATEGIVQRFDRVSPTL